MKTEAIKKFRLKKGSKYILIVPKSTGLTARDLANIDSEFVQLSILVNTARGVKVIEA